MWIIDKKVETLERKRRTENKEQKREKNISISVYWNLLSEI